MIILTKDLLDKGRSSNGAFNKLQVEALGLKWGDMKSGWVKALVGCHIKDSSYYEFMGHKDSHLHDKKDSNFLHQMISAYGEDRLKELILMAKEIESIGGSPSTTIKKLLEL